MRLGLALNVAVFYREVFDNLRKAVRVAREAILTGEDKLEESDEATYKETKAILQLLKENEAKWVEQDKDGELGEEL